MIKVLQVMEPHWRIQDFSVRRRHQSQDGCQYLYYLAKIWYILLENEKLGLVHPEMVLLVFSSLLVDFRVQWQNVIDEKSNSLLNRHS